MNLYREVLIETIEQAEALPVGTVALDIRDDGKPYEASVKLDPNSWKGSDHDIPYTDRHMVGDQALVPVEAVVETVASGDERSIPLHEGLMPNGDVVPNGWTIYTRFTSPWEKA